MNDDDRALLKVCFIALTLSNQIYLDMDKLK